MSVGARLGRVPCGNLDLQSLDNVRMSRSDETTRTSTAEFRFWVRITVHLGLTFCCPLLFVVA